MVTEDYVSFETVELLKERGMDESCFNHYVQKNNSDGTSEAVTVCSLETAMKWLRKKHKLFIEINYNFYLGWLVDIKHTDKYTYIEEFSSIRDNCYDSYEKACNGAILFLLRDII